MQRAIDDVKSIVQKIRPRASAAQQQNPYIDRGGYIPNADFYEMDDAQTVGGAQSRQDMLTYDEMLDAYGVRVTTSHDKFWRPLVNYIAVVSSVILMLILGITNGMLFSSFASDVTWFVVFMYIVGICYESLTMAIIFGSAFAYRDGEKDRGRKLLAFAIFLSLVSLSAQILFVFYQANKSEYDTFTGIFLKMHMPLPVWIVFLMRAIFPTIATFVIVFVLPKKQMDIEGAIQEQKKMQQGVRQLKEAEQEMELRDAIHSSELEQWNNYTQYKKSRQQVFVDELQPQTIVQRIEAPKAPERKAQQPVRASKPIPESKPIPFPTARKSVHTGVLTDSDVQDKVQMIMAQNPDALLTDIQQTLKTRGVTPERTKHAYEQMQQKALPAPNPLQKLDRDMLTKAQTTRMPESVEDDFEIEDLGEDSDVQIPLA